MQDLLLLFGGQGLSDVRLRADDGALRTHLTASVVALRAAVDRIQMLQLHSSWMPAPGVALAAVRLKTAVDIMLGIGGKISTLAAGTQWVMSQAAADRDTYLSNVGVAYTLASPGCRHSAATQTLHSLWDDPSVTGIHQWPVPDHKGTLYKCSDTVDDCWAPALPLVLSCSTLEHRVLHERVVTDETNPGVKHTQLYLSRSSFPASVSLGQLFLEVLGSLQMVCSGVSGQGFGFGQLVSAS